MTTRRNYRGGQIDTRRLSGILAAAMPARIPRLSTAILIAVVSILSACAAANPAVVEKLDDVTAVTVTRSRTPFIMSSDTLFDPKTPRDYVQIGAIEVNRMGTLKYYLWLGISDLDHYASVDRHPGGYESIVFTAGGEEFPLDVHGWTQEAIGISEPVYKKLFSSSVDAYYEVTLEHIQLLTAADGIKLRTSGSSPKEFILLYRQNTARDDLTEFVMTVLQ